MIGWIILIAMILGPIIAAIVAVRHGGGWTPTEYDDDDNPMIWPDWF